MLGLITLLALTVALITIIQLDIRLKSLDENLTILIFDRKQNESRSLSDWLEREVKENDDEQ